MEINLKLDLQDVNGVIAVLAQLPFGQVTELINKIRNQAIEQVQAATPDIQVETPEQVEG
jgi:hypothetical protein